MSVLMCPVCKLSLKLKDRTWYCDQGHSYDKAKQGYVNLHVVQHKHSKSPGDTVDAVNARREFLSRGFYEPLQKKILQWLDDLKINTLLDIGCGEGYYTSAMQQVVEECIGVDIAKTAVQRAAKLNSKPLWVVGTGAILPVLDESMDLCSSLFSPIPQSEILRVLKPHGYLLVVSPAPMHLYALREALFAEVRLHEPEKLIEQLKTHFELKQQEQIEVELVLRQDDLRNLLTMTPYAYKAQPERRRQLEQKSNMAVGAAFQIYLFQKK